MVGWSLVQDGELQSWRTPLSYVSIFVQSSASRVQLSAAEAQAGIVPSVRSSSYKFRRGAFRFSFRDSTFKRSSQCDATSSVTHLAKFVNRENVLRICLWAVEVTVYFRDDCSAASAPLASKHIIKHKSKPETWHLKFGPSSQIWCHCFYHKTVSEDLLEQILTLAAILATKSTSSLPKSLQIKMTS